jgi:hypothetical protein
MRFYVGQYVKVLGPYYYGNDVVVRITDINEEIEYPIRILNEQRGWHDTCTMEGCLYDSDTRGEPNSVYIEPLTKLERLLMGLE